MKVSIIVAACELELKTGKSRIEMLRKNLESIYQGGHKDFECLVCSDGYSKPIQDVVLGRKDPRYSYSCVPKRGIYGAGTQRNAMTAIASGQLLYAIDDDDRVVPNGIAKIVALAEKHPGHPLVFCMKYNSMPRTIWTDEKRISTPGQQFLKKGFIGTPMFVIPNIPVKLGRWGLKNYSDGEFVESTIAKGWPDAIWSKEVIAEVRSQHSRDSW